jgi:hypothetical protein
VGIRQTLNENPAITTAVTAGIIILAIVVILWQAFGKSGPSAQVPTKAFFSDDDGQTWFLDSADKIPPFDHDGKTAYRVQLFRCGEGTKPFVGHLEGFDDADKQKIDETVKGGVKAAVATAPRMGMSNGMKIKRPKETVWVKFDVANPQSVQEYQRIMQPVCPDGTMDGLRVVRPDDKTAFQ